MLRTFLLHTVGWTLALALVHSGMRALTGTNPPPHFLADLAAFAVPMLAIGALVGGIAASRVLGFQVAGPLRGVLRIAVVGGLVALGAYATFDQVSPRLLRAQLASAENATGWTEPRALTSQQLRQAAREAVEPARALDEAGQPAAEEWQTVNRIAFEHELRIVQALLIPIMGLIGLLAGARARKLARPWSAAVLWCLGLFLVFAMFMAGENGYELIVLRSAGPMAFVAWLQAVVPGSVLVGLSVATLPALLRSQRPSVSA